MNKDKLIPLVKGVEKVLAGINLFLLSSLLLIVCWQVISRYLLAAPSTVSEELARILLMCLGPLGAAYACVYREHMAIDLFAHKLKAAAQLRLQAFIDLCSAFVALMLIYGGIGLMQNALHLTQRTAVLGLPMGWIYAAVPLGGAFMFFFLMISYLAPEALPAADSDQRMQVGTGPLTGPLSAPPEVQGTAEKRNSDG